MTSGFSGRCPTGWLSSAATTRCGARSISFIANGPPMQLPKKKNWRMPRWSITPSWSSANAPQGSSTGTGPVDSPPVALRWSMVITRKSFLNSSGMLITALGQTRDARVQAAAGRRQQRKARADLGVADADVALLVESDLGARRQCGPCLRRSCLRRLGEHLRCCGRRRGGGAGRQNGAPARIDHRLPPVSLSEPLRAAPALKQHCSRLSRRLRAQSSMRGCRVLTSPQFIGRNREERRVPGRWDRDAEEG